MPKKILIGLGVATLMLILATGIYVYNAVKSVPQLFARNAELKADGYYMAEFEFKMVAIQYLLDQGQYLAAFTKLNKVRKEMATTQGLVKMPQDASSQEMAAFLTDRQYPSTGAFMNPEYPYFTYISPTLNAVGALESLTKNSDETVTLKYPLSFLDQIETPEALRTFLDSHLYMHEIWAGFGGPGPYVANSELAYFDELERTGIYRFSDEWKVALRQWFYETQDPATGFWGTRIGSSNNWHQRKDANSTYHILHLVLDAQGSNMSELYPLRYADKLVQNLLLLLDAPIPQGATAQHDWGLVQSQSASTITRLWSHLNARDQVEVRKAMVKYLNQRYRFYRSEDGGFSLYTESAQADVDGTANALALLRATGSIPGTWERERLWGSAIATIRSAELTVLDHWDPRTIPVQTDVNSLRVYTESLPEDGSMDDAHLIQINYPKSTDILDVMDLRQQLARFISTPGNEFGNWASKSDLVSQLHSEDVNPVDISHGNLDLPRIVSTRPTTDMFYVVAYDVFQVPLYQMAFRISN